MVGMNASDMIIICQQEKEGGCEQGVGQVQGKWEEYTEEGEEERRDRDTMFLKIISNNLPSGGPWNAN